MVARELSVALRTRDIRLTVPITVEHFLLVAQLLLPRPPLLVEPHVFPRLVSILIEKMFLLLFLKRVQLARVPHQIVLLLDVQLLVLALADALHTHLLFQIARQGSLHLPLALLTLHVVQIQSTLFLGMRVASAAIVSGCVGGEGGVGGGALCFLEMVSW